MQQHSGHAPHQWSVAVKLLSMGFNFLNNDEREKCHEGETASMELVFKESVVEYKPEGHGSNLMLKIMQQE